MTPQLSERLTVPALAPTVRPALNGEPQLPVLRYSLRALWIGFSAACVLVAVLASAKLGLAAVALLLAVSVVILHVAGTAIGYQLRAHADERRAWESLQKDSGGEVRRAGRLLAQPLSRSPLHGRGLPLRRLPLWVAAGATAGGVLGMAILAATIGHRTSAAGVLVGGFSTAIVGAWAAFVGASFGAILRAGLRDAVAEPRRDDVQCTGQS